ncbi:hypothetical protein [Sphingomonas sp. R86520]|uniref:hypothetical protein n=1 Tax=Sphingomonas sp. R86520 TaxID=3093859 RepID=UPI0036D291EC
MANRSDIASKDHKGLIYTITGGVLAAGVLMMAFYGHHGDPVAPTAHPAIVTAQK